MKKQLTAIIAASFVLTPALASDLEGHCVEFTTSTDRDPSGCSCLAREADASMTEELMAVASEADLEALSEPSQKALEQCWG